VKELRDFITVVDFAYSVSEPQNIIEESFDYDVPSVEDRLADLVFKLRSHSEPLNESVDGDYSLGVESGCEMAAEMIENLIRQLGDN
jgi:hypothetical protein